MVNPITVAEWIMSLKEGIEKAFPELGHKVSDIFSKAKSTITSSFHYFANLGDSLVSFANALWDGIKRVAKDIYDLLKKIFGAIKDKIVDFIKWITKHLTGLADSVFRTIMSAYNWIKNKFSEISRGFTNHVSEAIKHIATNTREKLVLMTTVNFSIIGMFAGLKKVTSGDVKGGIISMLSAPIAGIIAGSILDSLIPRPNTITPSFIYGGTIPAEGVEETISPEEPLFITPEDYIQLSDIPKVHVAVPTHSEAIDSISLIDDCLVTIVNGVNIKPNDSISLSDTCKTAIGTTISTKPYDVIKLIDTCNVTIGRAIVETISDTIKLSDTCTPTV